MLETKIHPFFQRFPYPAWIEIILPAGVGEIDGVGPELLGLLLPDGEGLDEGELVGELEDGEPPVNNKGVNMLGGIPRRWVHVCIAKRNLLDISEIYAAGSASLRPRLLQTKTRAKRARAHTQNTFHPILHGLGMVLGFYRPQKNLS